MKDNYKKRVSRIVDFMKLRTYGDSDYNAVKKILKEAGLFDKVWDSRKNLKNKIKNNPKSIILAIEKNKVAGCIYAQTDGWEGFLWRLAVSNKYRKRGIGTTLLRSAERFLRKKDVKEIGLFVNSKNTDLHKYYKKRGYISSNNTFKFFYTPSK